MSLSDINSMSIVTFSSLLNFPSLTTSKLPSVRYSRNSFPFTYNFALSTTPPLIFKYTSFSFFASKLNEYTAFELGYVLK